MNKQEISRELKEVIPALCLFAYNNRLLPNVSSTVTGEFFTLLRRHSKHNLFKPSGAGINTKNLDVIVVDGIIEHIEINQAQYGSDYSNTKINLYNEVLTTLAFNFKQLAFESTINSITNKVSNYKLNFSNHG